MAQQSHDNKKPDPIPVGGELKADKKSIKRDDSIAFLRGAKRNTFLAKSQWMRRWVVVSNSPHQMQLAHVVIPRLMRFSPTGRALWAIFQLNTFNLGENFPF